MKLTKFDRSQKAHHRLREKYFHSLNDKNHDVLFGYHQSVYMNQLQSRKVMSKAERKKTFECISKNAQQRKEKIK